MKKANRPDQLDHQLRSLSIHHSPSCSEPAPTPEHPFHYSRHYLPHLHYWTESALLPPSPSSSSSHVEIIIIPGNPGLASFYLPFAYALHHFLQFRYSIRCIHLGGFQFSHSFATMIQLNRFYADTMSKIEKNKNKEKKEKLEAIRRRNYAGKWTLQEQCEYLDELLSIVSHDFHQNSASFILIPHSIGSYCSLHTLQKNLNSSSSFTNYSISHCFLLFPFIRFDLSSLHFFFFRFLFLLRPFLPLLFFSLRLFPLSLLRFLIFLFSPLRHTYSVESFLSLIQHREMIQTFYELGANEFKILQKEKKEWEKEKRLGESEERAQIKALAVGIEESDRDEKQQNEGKNKNEIPLLTPLQKLRRVAPYISLYYSRIHDIWAPLSQYSSFQKSVPGLKMTILDDITHAFVAHLEQSRKVAERIAKEIEEKESVERKKGEGSGKKAKDMELATKVELQPTILSISASFVIQSRL